ncbi:MAG: hypothetical protein P1P83_07930 [Bacteroidales bacterium]|nr:hypothetical protein [Bacteroidales bacterium]MDT8373545.1 hypothetical protein [Bacteroidales bacterium]
MSNSDDSFSFMPGHIAFPMHALQYLNLNDLQAGQRRTIATKVLEYYRKCAQEEIQLIDDILLLIENLGSKS